MAETTICDLEGGAALCAWFEGIPSFHDAILKKVEFSQCAPGRLVIHTFRMESEVDAKGFFLQTKHVTVTLTLFELLEVELFDFMEAGIIFSLEIETDNDGITLKLESSYGVHGRMKAKRIVVSFEPGKSE